MVKGSFVMSADTPRIDQLGADALECSHIAHELSSGSLYERSAQSFSIALDHTIGIPMWPDR